MYQETTLDEETTETTETATILRDKGTTETTAVGVESSLKINAADTAVPNGVTAAQTQTIKRVIMIRTTIPHPNGHPSEIGEKSTTTPAAPAAPAAPAVTPAPLPDIQENARHTAAATSDP